MSEELYKRLKAILLSRVTDSFRYCPSFRRNGKSYIHDGRMLIEFDDQTFEHPVNDGRTRVPNPGPVLADIPSDGFQSLPFTESDLSVGSDDWTAIVECESCGGDGYQTCDMGHDHDCSDCNGEGTHIGLRAEAGEERDINGQTFARFYLFILSLIPAVEIVTYRAESRYSKMGFRFPGGRGVLMGIDKESTI